MTSSGQLLDSKTRHVECAETLHVNGHAYTSGCPFVGPVDVWFDPHNRDLQVRLAAQMQADALIVAARIRASHGPDSDLLAMLGLDD